MPGDLCTVPSIISLSSLSLATNETDTTLGWSDRWLETQTGAGGTATLTESFFDCSPLLHGQQVALPNVKLRIVVLLEYCSILDCGMKFTQVLVLKHLISKTVMVKYNSYAYILYCYFKGKILTRRESNYGFLPSIQCRKPLQYFDSRTRTI